LQPDPGFEIAIAIMIAIEKTIRIDRDPFLIAEPDPKFSGKIDPWVFLKSLFSIPALVAGPSFLKRLGKKYWKNDRFF